MGLNLGKEPPVAPGACAECGARGVPLTREGLCERCYRDLRGGMIR
jgi:NMD protein affecting ribosome stability and mRNA decay